MVADGNYMLNYYKDQNRIVILLPQTQETIMNTVTPMSDRNVELSDKRQRIILRTVRLCFEAKEEET